MNSGTFVFRPHQSLWEGIIEFLNTTELLEQFTFPDQNFLDEFFRGKWTAIGWQWNAVKTSRYWHPNIWRDEEVKVLHYIVDKPWDRRIGKDGVAGYLGRDGVTHAWWWDQWEKWVLGRQENGGLEGQEVLRAMEKLVAQPLQNEGEEGFIPERHDQLVSSTIHEPAKLRANYFTCTLGQAALINAKSPPNRNTILDILDRQAHVCPDSPAVGFSVPAERGAGQSWEALTLSMLFVPPDNSASGDETTHNAYRLQRPAAEDLSYSAAAIAICPASSRCGGYHNLDSHCRHSRF
jgi:hypothetical protein